MIDLSHIPSTTHLKTQVFYAIGSAKWQTWVKPKSIKFVHIFALAGGGGGAGAGTGLNTSTRAGGSGGGSSGIVSLMQPSSLVPDILYINVGSGGPGGAGTTSTGITNGTTGGNTIVALRPQVLNSDEYFTVNAGQGATTTGGLAGSVAIGDLAAYQTQTTSVGQIGATRIAGVKGVDVTISNITSGGASGGSLPSSAVTFTTGGSVTGSFAKVHGGLTDGEIGMPGFMRNPLAISTPFPFFATGGAGGASALSGTYGGAGGNGSWGCGGGGGGAGTGTSPITGGKGGNGGDGIVIITCY